MSQVETTVEEIGRTRGAVAKFQRFGTRLEHQIEIHPGRAFFALSAFYFVAVSTLSSFKLLWLDELITLHIARLGTIAAIWKALIDGADPNPPISHLLVHYCRLILGEHEFSLRLPAMLGYWIGLASLFAYLRRRLPSTWALAGTVLSMTMAAFDYSYESRSYAIFYGLTMLAILCWSKRVDPHSSPSAARFAYAGMIFALAAGISTNYFAVLAFFPIAIGEFARTYEIVRHDLREQPARLISWLGSFLRAVDWTIWLAILIASAPLLLFRPLIEHSIAQFAPYAWNKVSLDQVVDSYTEMVEIILYPILALLAFAILIKLLGQLCSTCRKALCPPSISTLTTKVCSSDTSIPMHEAVAVFSLMAYPFLGYLIASIHGGMLSPRLVIPVCFGFAIAGILSAFRLFHHLSQAGTIILFFCIAWFVTRESVVGYWYVEQKQCFYKVLTQLPNAELAVPAGAKIVVSDPLMALTFQYYAPRKIAARVVFPVDFPAIRQYRHDDSPEQNLWAGRKSLYTLPIVPLATFQQKAGQYLILASDGNWLIQDLENHRYFVQRLPINTRAGAIQGFTPLCHGVPAFFYAYGDGNFVGVIARENTPIPFTVKSNLPGS